MTTAPILQVKGNKPFAPFSNLNSEVALIQVWQAVSKASQFLEQGKRLENLSWRLWSLQALGEDSDDVALLNRGRVAGHILNRDKGAPALLPPSGQPKAKCCKIDPSVPCVHKKHKSTSRGALAAGPSVPLRAPTYQSAENIDSTTTDAFASSSRTTLDANPIALGLSQNLAPQQQPTQPLWPISNVSPHAHLAPSPFFQPSHNNQNQHAVPPAPQGVPSAAQMMLSALMDSLLSAGVAPSVAAQAVQQDPSGLMNTLTYQGLGPFGGIGGGDLQQQQGGGGGGTLPTTPMDWSTASFSTTNNFSHPFAPGPSETGSAVPVPEQRRVNDLRQQMQLSISTSTSSPTMKMSPAAMSEPSGSSLAAAAAVGTAATAGAVVDNADGKSASSSKQLSKKRASLDVGGTGSTAGSTSAKGKGKASTNPLQMSPDASSSSKNKDAVSGGTKRGPLQTTSSSARKAASTVASPAAPPDQAPPQCSNCGVKKTPLWRRCGEQHELLCNACGLYWAMHKTHRPEKLKHHRSGRNVGGGGGGAGAEDEDGYGPHGGSSGAGGTISEDDGPETLCSNCGTSTTPLWRKDREGNTVCNACGLFMKLHGNARPVKMRADVIKKRVRYDHPLSPTGGSGMSPLAGGSGSGGQGTMLLGSPGGGGGGGGMGIASGSGSTGENGMGMGIGLEAMDLDVALANLHASGAMLDPSSSSTRDLLSNFAHEQQQQQQQSGPSNGVSAAGPFATFHPGSDTLGRLTTTAGGSIPGTSTSTPLSQAQTPTAFAAQQHHHQQDPINAQQQQQQRHRQEQEQWAQAAGFLLPHEPVGDGFNFGQALWGCDLGVIGNWHAGTSPDGGGGPSVAGADGNGNGGGSAAGVGAADTGSGGGGGGGDLNGF
ncbi:hypothetical protein CF327_g2325 [Tilletia walkeri]|nr:hypothetical protein CF327_g2325 [Tilletia walkeri]